MEPMDEIVRDYRVEEVVAFVGTVAEKESIVKQHGLEYCTTDNDQGMAEQKGDCRAYK